MLFFTRAARAHVRQWRPQFSARRQGEKLGGCLAAACIQRVNTFNELIICAFRKHESISKMEQVTFKCSDCCRQIGGDSCHVLVQVRVGPKGHEHYLRGVYRNGSVHLTDTVPAHCTRGQDDVREWQAAVVDGTFDTYKERPTAYRGRASDTVGGGKHAVLRLKQHSCHYGRWGVSADTPMGLRAVCWCCLFSPHRCAYYEETLATVDPAAIARAGVREEVASGSGGGRGLKKRDRDSTDLDDPANVEPDMTLGVRASGSPWC